MIEDFVFVEQYGGIEICLTSSPETPLPYASRVMRVVVSEEHMLAEEIFSLELLLLGEGILWLGLKIGS